MTNFFNPSSQLCQNAGKEKMKQSVTESKPYRSLPGHNTEKIAGIKKIPIPETHFFPVPGIRIPSRPNTPGKNRASKLLLPMILITNTFVSLEYLSKVVETARMAKTSQEYIGKTMEIV